MVKIRLRRMGNKHRPYYRIVVAKSTAARNGAFKELIGTYDPLTQPKTVKIDGERAMYWLMEGAQPTETVARLLKGQGLLDEFFSKRPKAKQKYKFLDKTTGAMSKKSVVQEIPAAPPEIEAPAVEEPVVESAPDASVEPPTVAAAPEAPVEEPTAEPAAVEEAKPEESAADAPATEEKPAE